MNFQRVLVGSGNQTHHRRICEDWETVARSTFFLWILIFVSLSTFHV